MFVGIDSVVFGTSDLGEARKFFTDWGLQTVEDGRREKIFATQIGSRIVVRAENARGLAPPLSPAGGFREVVWGVRGKRDLARLAKELGADRDLKTDPDGTIHTTDPNGIGIGFRVWRHRKRLSVKAAAFNTGADRRRIDTPGPLYDEGARPLRMGHVVFLAADIQAAEKFYRDRLGFHLSDRYSGDRAVFLRCSPENEHHNLFFLNTNGAKTELQHVAFELRDIHEVFGGGVRMKQLGYRTDVGPGRHPVSSAYFWYFASPLGGSVEYYADSDYATEAWKPRTIEGVRFSQWHVQDGVGPAVGGGIREERPSG